MDRWVVQEMGAVDLKDKRRNDRACQVLESLAAIGDSTPDAVRNVAELKATYRLMDMKQVTPLALLAPHREQTIKRTSSQPRVLLVQDTTEVDLTRPQRQIEGAGPLTSNHSFGFYLHPMLAYTDQGVPLGVVASHHWARTELDTTSTPAEKRRKRYLQPIEDKESFRWVEMIGEAKQLAAAHRDTQYVSVADSESDIYELLAQFENRSDNFHLLIRACHDRSVLDWEIAGKNELATDGIGSSSMGSVLAASPVVYQTTVDVAARKGSPTEKRKRHKARSARTADLEVYAAQVTLKPPRRTGGGKLPAITLNVVQALESHPPAGEEPVEWVLLTTLPINDEENLKQILSDYQHRWLIENYFMTLKSGLGIEKLQYRKIDRYFNAMTMLMIVAWRVQLLTHAARVEPDLSCETYFEPSQWKSVYLIANIGSGLPDTAPTNGTFLTMVAQLGGYINKKSQGPPGTKTVWRGIKRMNTLAEAFNVFGDQSTCGV